MRCQVRAWWVVLLGVTVGQLEGYSMGMGVSPGGALLQGIPLGTRVELGVPITIRNDNPDAVTYTVEAIRPSQQKMKMVTGYGDLPDPSWISFAPSEVTVPGKKHGTTKMIFEIPSDPKYYDQHWSVALSVRTKVAKGQFLALAVYPRYEIETVSAADTAPGVGPVVRPHGKLVVTPAISTVPAAVPGRKSEPVSLTVWNNQDGPWSGEVLLVNDAEAAKKERLTLSTGWQWLPESSWVKLNERSLRVGPSKSKRLSVEILVPERQDYRGRAWEAILLLRCKGGPEAIARLRVATVPAEKPGR